VYARYQDPVVVDAIHQDIGVPILRPEIYICADYKFAVKNFRQVFTFGLNRALALAPAEDNPYP